MTVLAVGKATIARVEETYGPTYPPRDIFPEWSNEILAEHAHWLAPNHYDSASGLLKLSVHSWLLQIGRQKILIDTCCGNHKVKAGAAVLAHARDPYLERLAAAGARPHEIDFVMCTHLHHDHVGWNTQLKDGRWVPTFPNARYVISKPDFEYFQTLDADPENGPAELGTFRECVLPVVEAGRADLVTGPHRLNEHVEIVPAPGHSAGQSCSSSKAAASARSSSAMCSTISCRCSTRTGIFRRTRMPNRRARAVAGCSRIARRPARWCCLATSARRSPAASRRPPRDLRRALVEREQQRDGGNYESKRSSILRPARRHRVIGGMGAGISDPSDQARGAVPGRRPRRSVRAPPGERHRRRARAAGRDREPRRHRRDGRGRQRRQERARRIHDRAQRGGGAGGHALHDQQDAVRLAEGPRAAHAGGACSRSPDRSSLARGQHACRNWSPMPAPIPARSASARPAPERSRTLPPSCSRPRPRSISCTFPIAARLRP